MDATNRSNTNDRVVRVITVYENGRVSHRDVTKGRAPWTKGSGWGRAGAHAAPDESPSAEAPAPRVKNPVKVAAGKARAAQAAARKAAEQQAAAKAATPKARKPKAAAKKAKPAAKAHGGARKGSGPKPANGSAMVVVAFRVTPEQKRKLDKLGNGAFMRDRIDRASV